MNVNMRYLVLVAATLQIGFAGSRSVAYTPTDPEVQAMVSRGIRYLESMSVEELSKQSSHGGHEYHVVLVAYAHLKAEHDPSAKIVRQGVDNALALAREIANVGRRMKRGAGSYDKSTYGLSVCILLLCEAGSDQYESEIEDFVTPCSRCSSPLGASVIPAKIRGIHRKRNTWC